MTPPTSGDAGSPGSVTASLRSLGIEPTATFFVPRPHRGAGESTPTMPGGGVLLCCTGAGVLVASGGGGSGDDGGGGCGWRAEFGTDSPLFREAGGLTPRVKKKIVGALSRHGGGPGARDFPGIPGGRHPLLLQHPPRGLGDEQLQRPGGVGLPGGWRRGAGCGRKTGGLPGPLREGDPGEGGRTRERLADYLAAVESGRPYAGLGGGAGARGVGDRRGERGPHGHPVRGAGEPGCATVPPDPGRGVGCPFPPGGVLAVAASGVLAEKAAGARGGERTYRLSGRGWGGSRPSGAGRRGAPSPTPVPSWPRPPVPGTAWRGSCVPGKGALLARFPTVRPLESGELIPAAAEGAGSGGGAGLLGEVVARSQAGAEGVTATTSFRDGPSGPERRSAGCPGLLRLRGRLRGGGVGADSGRGGGVPGGLEDRLPGPLLGARPGVPVPLWTGCGGAAAQES